MSASPSEFASSISNTSPRLALGLPYTPTAYVLYPSGQIDRLTAGSWVNVGHLSPTEIDDVARHLSLPLLPRVIADSYALFYPS
jgi:hypothetical protein